MALQHGVTHLVLSAFGCGAYRNPPQHVAQLFKQVLMQEYDGKFSQVIFAIYNDANAMRRGDGGNVEPFEKEFGIKASVFKEQ
ncbi:hypothetical protein C9374_007851 [Naegleria lovaniensis]|uniref:Microbial-type PARG catalytic domain-containing protein n=1 Tax=Naegleria lovaniensis TaxID=51637 RepID=A0AA88KIB3_NAELO|nr:uncharacterized protein C9374_007851 [Naegleria lovaniensis]KAG2378703.1 hypothetical protein C9374_007851 [Naegleria lovaniensis]